MKETENITEVKQTYLSFKLGDETFALMVDKVIKIVDVSAITHVPQAPDYMKGLMNLRGKVIPVIDTRLKLSLDPTEISPDTSIIVISLTIGKQEMQLGALVDEVLEVLEVNIEKVQQSPSLEADYNLDFIKGVLEHEERFLMLLDIEKVFSVEDVEEVTITENQ